MKGFWKRKKKRSGGGGRIARSVSSGGFFRRPSSADDKAPYAWVRISVGNIQQDEDKTEDIFAIITDGDSVVSEVTVTSVASGAGRYGEPPYWVPSVVSGGESSEIVSPNPVATKVMKKKGHAEQKKRERMNAGELEFWSRIGIIPSYTSSTSLTIDSEPSLQDLTDTSQSTALLGEENSIIDANNDEDELNCMLADSDDSTVLTSGVAPVGAVRYSKYKTCNDYIASSQYQWEQPKEDELNSTRSKRNRRNRKKENELESPIIDGNVCFFAFDLCAAQLEKQENKRASEKDVRRKKRDNRLKPVSYDLGNDVIGISSCLG